MQNSNRLFTVIILALLFTLPLTVFSNGLNLNGVGSKAVAMGGAFVGLADDHSAIFFNPAGLSQLEGTSMNLYITDVIPKGTYEFSMYGVDAETESNHYVSGSASIFFDVGEKIKLGGFVDVPSGLGAEWDGADLAAFSGPAMTPFEWMSKIGVIHFGPAIAYQVNEKLSVGATVNIAYGMMDLKRPVDMLDMSAGQPAPGSDGAVDTQYEEESTGMGFNLNLGVLYKVNDMLQVGASVKTQNKIAFSGTAKNQTMALIGAAAESDFDRDITWPLWVGGGIAVKPIEKLTITADAQWSQWAKNQEVLETEYKDIMWAAALGAQGADKMHLKWDNALQLRFGAEYLVTKCLALRLGYTHDPEPSPDETTNILLPSLTYNTITFGFGWKKNVLGIDLGFEYLIGTERDIAPSMEYENNPGLHNMKMMVPNISFTYDL